MSTTTPTSESAATTTTPVALAIGGMTCASCAMRIEKKLNKLEGVTATVNYATEQAKVTAPEGVSVDELIAAVESAGYTAALPRQARAATDEAGEPTEIDETASLRTRLYAALGLAVPVIVLAMIPSFQFDGWQWLSLTLTAPVVTWGAWPFHRAAWVNAKHAAATMDTLISIGVTAAFGWSLYALFFGTAGEIGMTHGFSWTAERGAGDLPRGGRPGLRPGQAGARGLGRRGGGAAGAGPGHGCDRRRGVGPGCHGHVHRADLWWRRLVGGHRPGSPSPPTQQ